MELKDKQIARFTPEDKERYEESLKSYRDFKNVVDASYEEGKIEGKLEGKIEGKLEGKMEIARQMKAEGESIEKIIRFTGLSHAEIERL